MQDSGSPASADTLVLYAYANSDPEYERNLHFFVEHGMSEDDGVDYVIFVQQVSLLWNSFRRKPQHSMHLSQCV